MSDESLLAQLEHLLTVVARLWFVWLGVVIVICVLWWLEDTGYDYDSYEPKHLEGGD